MELAGRHHSNRHRVGRFVGGGRTLVAVVAAAWLVVACSSAGLDEGSQDHATGTGGGSVPTGSVGDGSVLIVEPSSVEAFCALSAQLDDLATTQLGGVAPSDAEAFRTAFAGFVRDNQAVIDQYVAAAPPEIESEVDATVEQARTAIDDPVRFDQAMEATGPSNRVSAFIVANCR